MVGVGIFIYPSLTLFSDVQLELARRFTNMRLFLLYSQPESMSLTMLTMTTVTIRNIVEL